MNTKKFSEAMNEVDDKYYVEAANYQPMRRKNNWVKWAAMAACLCLIVGGIYMYNLSHEGKIIVNQYRASTSGSYPIPSAGQIMFDSAVKEAREKYSGKDVTYLLAFNIFENEEILSSEKLEEEYQRLISEGYELYTAEHWTYQGKGEKKYSSVVVGYFTEEQLSLFKNNSQYGYFFYFVTNGDGSGIKIDNNNLISDFPTNHS